MFRKTSRKQRELAWDGVVRGWVLAPIATGAKISFAR